MHQAGLSFIIFYFQSIILLRPPALYQVQLPSQLCSKVQGSQITSICSEAKMRKKKFRFQSFLLAQVWRLGITVQQPYFLPGNRFKTMKVVSYLWAGIVPAWLAYTIMSEEGGLSHTLFLLLRLAITMKLVWAQLCLVILSSSNMSEIQSLVSFTTRMRYCGLLNQRSSVSGCQQLIFFFCFFLPGDFERNPDLAFDFLSLSSQSQLCSTALATTGWGQGPPLVLPCHLPSMEYVYQLQGKTFEMQSVEQLSSQSLKFIHQEPYCFLLTLLLVTLSYSFRLRCLSQSQLSSEKGPVHTPSLPQGLRMRINFSCYLAKSLISTMGQKWFQSIPLWPVSEFLGLLPSTSRMQLIRNFWLKQNCRLCHTWFMCYCFFAYQNQCSFRFQLTPPDKSTRAYPILTPQITQQHPWSLLQAFSINCTQNSLALAQQEQTLTLELASFSQGRRVSTVTCTHFPFLKNWKVTNPFQKWLLLTISRSRRSCLVAIVASAPTKVLSANTPCFNSNSPSLSMNLASFCSQCGLRHSICPRSCAQTGNFSLQNWLKSQGNSLSIHQTPLSSHQARYSCSLRKYSCMASSSSAAVSSIGCYSSSSPSSPSSSYSCSASGS